MDNLKEEKILRLRLSLVKGIGPRKFIDLINRYGTAVDLYKNINDLKSFNERLYYNIFNSNLDIEKYLNNLQKNNIGFMTYGFGYYPASLSNIYDPPIVLYHKGAMEKKALDNCFSIVGSRTPNSYGNNAAFSFSSSLCKTGMVIVSGMAIGADRIVHQACLDSKGYTCAVLASSVEIPSPYCNKDIYYRILESGIIISEEPFGTKPDPWKFPKRNRIIAGLSIGTLILQAKIKSGALITARYAFNENRNVYAIPGNIYDSSSTGNNFLVKNFQAKLVTSPQDIIEDLDINYNFAPDHDNLSNTEEKIIQILSGSPMSIDDLSLKLPSIPVSKLLEIITMLELKARVKKVSTENL